MTGRHVVRRANINVAPSPRNTAAEPFRILTIVDGRLASPSLAFAAQYVTMTSTPMLRATETKPNAMN